MAFVLQIAKALRAAVPVGLVGRGCPGSRHWANLCGGSCLYGTRKGNWRGVGGEGRQGLWMSVEAFKGSRQDTLWGVLGDGTMPGSVSKETISWGLSPAGFRAAGLYVQSLNKQD